MLNLPFFCHFLPFLGEGGDLTLFMTGKKPRPDTEPMYSGGNLHEYPISDGYDLIEYTDFISSYTINSQRILITQSMHNGYFSACFVTSTLYSPRPAVTWWIRRDLSSFLAYVQKQWKKSMRIYSLACDEKFGFGVFLMENYGTNQIIATNKRDIKNFWADGFKVTACTAQGSAFYVIMTQGTEEYEGKKQMHFSRETWPEVNTKIVEGYENGKVVTGICYLTELEKYFVVMTEMSHRQCYFWQTNCTKEAHVERENCVKEKENMGYYLSIVFTDPTDDNILFVMTKDKSVKSSKSHAFYRMKT